MKCDKCSKIELNNIKALKDWDLHKAFMKEVKKHPKTCRFFSELWSRDNNFGSFKDIYRVREMEE